MLFRLGVNLRSCLCGVQTYASAQYLDFLARTKNPRFPIRKLPVSHPEFPEWKLTRLRQSALLRQISKSEAEISLQHCHSVKKDQDADDDQENAGYNLKETDIFFEVVEEVEETVNCQCREKEWNPKAERVNEKENDATIVRCFLRLQP